MRLIGMLLMGLFMLQPDRAEASVKMPVAPRWAQIEASTSACDTVESSAACDSLDERPIAWMSGCGPLGRHRQRRNLRRRLQRLMRLASHRLDVWHSQLWGL